MGRWPPYLGSCAGTPRRQHKEGRKVDHDLLNYDGAEGQRAELARMIKAERQARNLSQTELAATAGVAKNTVIALEKGRPVRLGNLRAVVDALHLEVVAPATQSPKVATVLDMLARYLSGLDPEAADEVAADLMAYVIRTMPTQPNGPNGTDPGSGLGKDL